MILCLGCGVWDCADGNLGELAVLIVFWSERLFLEFWGLGGLIFALLIWCLVGLMLVCGCVYCVVFSVWWVEVLWCFYLGI